MRRAVPAGGGNVLAVGEESHLLRRRSFFIQQRSQLIAHIVNSNSQFNLPPLPKKLTYAGNRSDEIATRFRHLSTQLMIRSDLALIDNYDTQIAALELHLTRTAKVDNPVTFGFLQTVPGIGPILGLILLDEIDQITRFPEVGHFLSNSRLVRCERSSAGKVKGFGPRKVGNARRHGRSTAAHPCARRKSIFGLFERSPQYKTEPG